MDGPPAPRPWTVARIVLTLLGLLVGGFGVVVAVYGIYLVAVNPLLLVIGIPFVLFGALLVLAGLALVAGPWLRWRWRLRKARRAAR